MYPIQSIWLPSSISTARSIYCRRILESLRSPRLGRAYRPSRLEPPQDAEGSNTASSGTSSRGRSARESSLCVRCTVAVAGDATTPPPWPLRPQPRRVLARACAVMAWQRAGPRAADGENLQTRRAVSMLQVQVMMLCRVELHTVLNHIYRAVLRNRGKYN